MYIYLPEVHSSDRKGKKLIQAYRTKGAGEERWERAVRELGDGEHLCMVGG